MENNVNGGGVGVSVSGGTNSSNNENPHPNSNNYRPTTTATTNIEEESTLPPSSHRTPFTNLSQIDADLALARTLQEQERAYMMLRMNGEGGGSSSSGHGGRYATSEEDGSYDDGQQQEEEDDAFDVHENLEHQQQVHVEELDPSAFSSDEAFARALQDSEDRELTQRMMALTRGGGRINLGWNAEDETEEDNDTNSQDTWEEVDPDELSYEELLALGEVVGTESRGLSADTIASLPSVSFKAQSNEDGSSEQCVICRLEYEDEDSLTVLSCKHTYHSECINNWLQINKVCPVCSAEVSASENR